MSKEINIECEGCESQYELRYEEGMIMESDEGLFCPFCGESIGSVEEAEEPEEFPNVWGDDDDD